MTGLSSKKNRPYSLMTNTLPDPEEEEIDRLEEKIYTAKSLNNYSKNTVQFKYFCLFKLIECAYKDYPHWKLEAVEHSFWYRLGTSRKF